MNYNNKSISFNLQNNTPRVIPFKVKLSIVFVNFNFGFGLLFFLIGLPLGIFFISDCDFKSMTLDDSELKKTIGIVNAIKKTNATENKQKILEFNFAYTIKNTSYSANSYNTDTEKLMVGDTVTVLYKDGSYNIAKIEGMRFNKFNGVVLVGLIFPLTGLIFMLYSILMGIKNINILTNGIITKAKIIKMETTPTRNNKNIVYKVHFQFKDLQGNAINTFIKTHLVNRINDEEEETIVYLQDKQTQAFLVDVLPKAVKVYIESL